MKTPTDFLDKVYSILIQGSIESEIKGDVFIGTCNEIVDETILIKALPSQNSDDVVDNCSVNINLWIVDKTGQVDRKRFRYLINKIKAIIGDYEKYQNDIVQNLTKNDGTADEITTSGKEYFKLKTVFSTDPDPDPERPAYSWWSIRLNCYYEH